MKIKTLKDMGFEGKHTPAGSILEVKETLARELVGNGRAELAEGEAETVVEVEGPARFPGDDTLEGVEDEAPAKPAKRK
jgi:hypothetical protein